MKAYLSIDLDYWCYSTERNVLRFFDRVFDLQLPIFVAPYHDQLLPHIEKSNCNTIINVDFHSDLCDLPATPPAPCHFNEGTWGNFVSWKEQGKFIWRFPDARHMSQGFCHAGYDPFKNPCYSGWRSTVRKQGIGDMPWKSVRAIGLCLSSYWLGSAPVKKITDRLQITQWKRLPEKYQRAERPFLWTAA